MLGACQVAGTVRTTRGTVALAEAHLSSIDARISYLAAVQRERCLRLPQGNLARKAMEREEKPGATRPSTRRRARAELEAANLDEAPRAFEDLEKGVNARGVIVL